MVMESAEDYCSRKRVPPVLRLLVFEIPAVLLNLHRYRILSVIKEPEFRRETVVPFPDIGAEFDPEVV